MASGSLRSVRISKETVRGTTNANPVFNEVRQTGITLAETSDDLRSDETRPDRQIISSTPGASDVKGDISTDLSYGAQDDLIAAALCGVWTPKATITATTISAQAGDNSFNDSGNGFVAAGFEVGDNVKVLGFTGNTANNILSGVVTAVTAGKLTLGGTDGDVIVDDAAGESVTIVSRVEKCKAGTTRTGFTFEILYGDIAPADKPYHRFRGVEVDSIKLSLPNKGKLEAVFGLVGIDFAMATAALAGATYVSAPANDITNTFSGTFKEGGVVSEVITDITLSLENKLSTRFVLGKRTSLSPDIDLSDLSIEGTAYLENSALIEKFKNSTESSLEFTAPDAQGNMITFTIPRIKIMSAAPDGKGGGSLFVKFKAQALRDPTLGSQIVVTRTPKV